jgi:hypothetical protein
MSNNFENMVVASVGWQETPWSHAFYPEDMPEDWQLKVLPQIWSAWQKSDLEEFVEALDDQPFKFYFDTDGSNLQLAKLVDFKRILGNRFLGLSAPIETDLGDELVHQVTYLGHKSLAEEWFFDLDGVFYSGFPCITIDIKSLDLSAVKTLLIKFHENLDAYAPSHKGLVFVDGAASIEQVQQVKTLVELLGY